MWWGARGTEGGLGCEKVWGPGAGVGCEGEEARDGGASLREVYEYALALHAWLYIISRFLKIHR